MPCGVHSQVPQEDALRGVATTSRGSVSKLAIQKESRVEEGHLTPDHVHMMISIPPKYAVSQVIGYIKGKALSIWPIRKQEAEDSRLDQLNMWR